MAVFIDTSIFVAARNRRDVNHARAVELLREAFRGRYGTVYSSDYVFDEAVTVALVRTKKPELALDLGNFILSSKKLRILYVTRETFKESWRIFQKYAERGLSFTDAITLALMEKHRVEYIMSFDKHFDGLVPRIC